MNALQPDIDCFFAASQYEDCYQAMAWVDELQGGEDFACVEWAKRTTSWVCAGRHRNDA